MTEVQISKSATVTHWANKIRPHLAGAVEHIVAAGRELINAKGGLPHGEFGVLLSDLGISRRTAQKFMAIAGNELIANASQGSLLPSGWTTLFELSTLPEDDLRAAIQTGRVHAGTTRAEVLALKRPPADAVIARLREDIEAFVYGLSFRIEATLQEVPADLTQGDDPLLALLAKAIEEGNELLLRAIECEPGSEENRAALIGIHRTLANTFDALTRMAAERKLRYQSLAGEALKGIEATGVPLEAVFMIERWFLGRTMHIIETTGRSETGIEITLEEFVAIHAASWEPLPGEPAPGDWAAECLGLYRGMPDLLEVAS